MAFTITSELKEKVAWVTLVGELDGAVADSFRNEVSNMAALQPAQLVIDMKQLEYMSSAGLRVLVFARQKMGANIDIYLVGANESVRETVEMTGFHHSVIMQEEFDPSQAG